MAGDYFAAAMGEAAVEAAGTTPLRPYLDAIANAGSLGDLPAIACALQKVGVNAFHGMEASPDFEDSDAYLAYIGQGGLGLPECGYYTRNDDASVALRSAYVDHVAAQLGFLGETDAPPREAAERILAFEARLAEASYPPEKMRDVQLTLNRHAVSSLDGLMPRFGLRAHVVALGVTGESVNVDNPGFFSALDEALAETPIGTLRDYLRWQLVRTYANALPGGVRQRELRVLRPQARGPAEATPALEAHAAGCVRRHRRTGRAGLRGGRVL
jgi:putative endopeptidase